MNLFSLGGFFGALPEFFRDWAESAFCSGDADGDWFRLRSDVQKFHPISETVTKDVYNNANAGSRFDGRNNGEKQSSSSSCSPNSRNILSPNQFWRAVRIFFSIAIVCSTEIRMWTTSVRQRSLHKRGTLFQARTPLTLVLSPRIRVRDEKS